MKKILKVYVEVEDEQGHSYKTWISIENFWETLLDHPFEDKPILKNKED